MQVTQQALCAPGTELPGLGSLSTLCSGRGRARRKVKFQLCLTWAWGRYRTENIMAMQGAKDTCGYGEMQVDGHLTAPAKLFHTCVWTKALSSWPVGAELASPARS